MAVLKVDEAHSTNVREGVNRRLVHTKNLMMVVIDFDNGPWKEPDPLHHHVHEQTTYVAAGKIIFFCEDDAPQILKAGDMFFVASDKKHAIQLLTRTAKLIDSFNPLREDFLTLL